jgi:hypothetical protein
MSVSTLTMCDVFSLLKSPTIRLPLLNLNYFASLHWTRIAHRFSVVSAEDQWRSVCREQHSLSSEAVRRKRIKKLQPAYACTHESTISPYAWYGVFWDIQLYLDVLSRLFLIAFNKWVNSYMTNERTSEKGNKLPLLKAKSYAQLV